MTGDRLEINDFECDLDDATVIAVTSQINDLNNLQDRQAIRTNQFKLKKTIKNQIIFENIDLVTSTSLIPYRRLKAKVVKGGIEIIPSGFAIVNKSNSCYEVTVYSGNFDFFNEIGNRRLRDLDLSALNFDWDFTNMMSIRTNTSGVKFALFNHGDITNGSMLVNVENQRPSIFINDVLLKIFEEAGFTVSGKILTDANYLKIMMTLMNDESDGPYFDNTNGRIHFDKWDTNPPSLIPSPTTIEILAGETWTFTYKVRFNIPVWSNTPLSILKFYGFSGGTPIYTHTSSSGTHQKTFTDTFTNSLGVSIFITPVMTLVNLGLVNFYSGSITGQRSGDVDPMFYIHIPSYSIGSGGYGSTSSFGSDLMLTYNGSTFDVAASLPDWTQKDFVKMVFNLCGVIPSSDKFARHINLKLFNEIIEAKSIAKDYSDKLHVARLTKDGDHPNVETRFTSYAQRNYFRYTQDDLDKFISSELGTGIFTIDDETIPIEKEVLTIPCAGSLMGKFLDNYDVAFTSTRIDPVTGMIKEKMIPRLLIDDTRITTGDPFKVEFFDNYGNNVQTQDDIPFCYFELATKDFNLSFQNSLIADYYSGLVRSLQYAKKVDAWFKINETDFDNLDHFIPVYIDFFSSYFYINKVLNWTNKINSLTKLELIKI